MTTLVRHIKGDPERLFPPLGMLAEGETVLIDSDYMAEQLGRPGDDPDTFARELVAAASNYGATPDRLEYTADVTGDGTAKASASWKGYEAKKAEPPPGAPTLADAPVDTVSTTENPVPQAPAKARTSASTGSKTAKKTT